MAKNIGIALFRHRRKACGKEFFRSEPTFFGKPKNVGSLHKKMTMHAFFRRKNSLCVFKNVFSYAHPSMTKLLMTK